MNAVNNKIHLWQGEWLNSEELAQNVENIRQILEKSLQYKFPLNAFLEACEMMHKQLAEKGELYNNFFAVVEREKKLNSSEIKDMMDAIIEFIKRENLMTKLTRELGNENPFEIRRLNYKEDFFEGWAPLGFVVHIAPSNVFTVSILGLIEGLLTGNINFLKTSGSESLLPQMFYEKLIEFDYSGILKNFIIIARISSSNTELLKKILSYSDAVSAWGSEEAIKAIAEMTPDNTKIIKWGHKISFAYIAKENLDNESELIETAKDICRIEQQACSSPQNLYVEVESFEELKQFSEKFAVILDKVSRTIPKIEPEFAFYAEINNIVQVAQAEAALDLTHVIRADDKSWTLIADKRKALRASPLYRTIWLKALLKDEIISTLYPMRSYLQTVGLSCALSSFGELSTLFFKAGTLRLNRVGNMVGGYIGEPHDGKIALTEFMKRVSINLGTQLEKYSSLSEFQEPEKLNLTDKAVLTKAEFQASSVPVQYQELTFTSGGSSGKPTFSYFTYKDYHTQMKASADGLFAAELDPKKDKVMNLMVAGHFYGGFLSFFSIFENLEVAQLPVGLLEETTFVAESIIRHKSNVLCSLPSYIIKLFKENEKLFKENRIVEKIYYGGEHISQSQIEYLKNEFGVKIVRSAAYGSNDAGPIGYQCPYCTGGVHHLLSSLQHIEIFKLEEDAPAEIGEAGRIMLTSKKRKGQQIVRYEIGDIGRIISKQCQCGRKDQLFELMGRSGDVFKAGGPYLNYNSFARLLDNKFSYSGNSQLVLEIFEENNFVRLLIDKSIEFSEKEIRDVLIENYEDLKFSVESFNLKFEVEKINNEEFVIIPHSGKIKKVIEKRL